MPDQLTRAQLLAAAKIQCPDCFNDVPVDKPKGPGGNYVVHVRAPYDRVICEADRIRALAEGWPVYQFPQKIPNYDAMRRRFDAKINAEADKLEQFIKPAGE